MNDPNGAPAEVQRKPKMTGRRLVLRLVGMALGTIGVLALFGELRWGGAAILFTALYVGFFLQNTSTYLRHRQDP